MDVENYSTPRWNPLADVIRPGQKVVLKPNLVRHLHVGGGDFQAVVTHPSVIRCVLDYVALALGGQGQITVGDSPVQSADFSELMKRNKLQEVCDDVSECWQMPVRLVDFRLSHVCLGDHGRVISRDSLDGDPAGTRRVDLGERSLLSPLDADCSKFRVTCYDPRTMSQYHHRNSHQYAVAQSVLDADVVVNLPKLKTHRKVGLTAALKNVVGINAQKDCLPHHRTGSARHGGDEYRDPSLIKRWCSCLAESVDRAPRSPLTGLRRLTSRALMRLHRYVAKDPYWEGSWHGNDTLWRTVLDLNRLLLYADRQGNLTDRPQRRCLTIVDAIVAGEGEGPMEPDRRPCGLLAAGINPVAVDAVLATLVGFDYKRLPLIANAFDVSDLPLVDFRPDHVRVLSSQRRLSKLHVGQPYHEYAFRPPSGWQGHTGFRGQGETSDA